MQILLEEFYKIDISNEKFHDRKVFLDEKSYQIVGITQSGKTRVVKNYLLSLKKSTYLYIDCNDVRIDFDEINKTLSQFCIDNKIDTLIFDNYKPDIEIVNVTQLIITSEIEYKFDFLETVHLLPLDYEEFLAYEHKYDSSALNHYLQLGGLPVMHKISADERISYIQKALISTLEPHEFEILKYCSKLNAQKISPFSIYERLKTTKKISKDKLYKSFDALIEKKYIHTVEKNNHSKAIKKVYLCDISLKSALSIDKHFGRLFENMVFLELYKQGYRCYYDEGINFYIPDENQIVLCKPFADERILFKKLEDIEAFIFTHNIKKVTTITMNKEGKVSHPLSYVEMIPFDIWAIGD